MKTLLSALVLTTTLTSAALAGAPVTTTGTARPEPIKLTEAQMDAVTAGGGGMGVDPSVYGGGVGVDPSAYGGGTDPGDGLIAFGTKGTAGQGGDTDIVSPTNN
jgi:hypothetical protein